MRVLHTADWHIGAKWDGVDRTDDLLGHAVPAVVKLALEEQVDLLLIAGDVFERQTVQSVQVAAETLRKPFRQLLDAGIDIALLIGNHDSPSLFRFLRSAIELAGNGTNNRGQVFVLNSPSVTLIQGLQVLHLPYLRAEQIDKVLKSQNPSTSDPVEPNYQLSQRLELIAEILHKRLDPRKPSLMTYHGIVAGATYDTADGESHEFTYRHDHRLPQNVLLANDQVPQFNALGHIHKCQDLSEAVPTWYAGSIDRLDLGERDYKPSVLLVEFPQNGRKVDVVRCKLPHPTPFLKDNIASHEELKTLCEQLGKDGCERALGRIELTCELSEAYALDEAIRAAFPRLKNVKRAVQLPRRKTQIDDVRSVSGDIEQLKNPGSTIRSYISEQVQEDDREGLLKALAVVEEELNHDH